jgi:hypothetical protein
MYGTIKQCLSREGLSKVKLHEDWADVSVAMNPSRLLEIVRNTHSMKTANVGEDTARYVLMNRYMNLRMSPDDTLSQFRDKFLLAIQNLRLVVHPQVPNDAQQARHFLMRLDTARYSEYQREELNNETRPGAVFPATIQAVMNGASRYIPTYRGSATRLQPMAYAFDAEKPCHTCGELGHWSPQCPQRNKGTGGAGYSSPPAATSTDPKKNAADDDKQEKKKYNNNKKHKKKKVTISANAAHMEADDLFEHVLNSYSSSFYSFTSNVSTVKLHPRAVSIDTLANHSFGWNAELMDNVQKHSFVMNGVNGKGNGTDIGWLPGFGAMALTPNSKVNAICACDIEEKYKVEYSPLEVYRVYVSHNLIINFIYDKNAKSYTCVFTNDLLNKLRAAESEKLVEVSANTATVSENESKFSGREIKYAQEARYLMRKLYHPSDVALTRTLTQGVFLNSPVTGADVLRATAIYGKDVASLKGKTKAGGPVASNEVLVPPTEQKEQTAYADIFFWREIPFLLFILKPLRLLMVQQVVGAQTAANLKPIFERLMTASESRGYQLTKIVTDPAKPLAALIGMVSANLTTVGASSHVADAEVEIRGVKERLRSNEQALPFPLARRLIKYEVLGVVGAINTVLRAGQTVSSRELYSGIKADLRRDYRVAFGEYCEVAVDSIPRNGPGERTASSVALCPVGNDRGTWWFYDIKTKSAFRGDKWTVMPTNSIVVDAMTNLYNQDEPRKRRLVKGVDNTPAPADVAEDPPSQVDAEEVADIIRVPTQRDEPTANAHIPVDDDGTERDDDVLAVDDVTQSHHDDASSSDNEEDDNTGRVDSPTPTTNDVIPAAGNSTPEERRFRYSTEDPADHLEHLGARIVAGVRKSFRISKKQTEGRILNAYRMSIAKAIRKNEKASKTAIRAELQQMLTKNVWSVIDKASLTKKQLKGIIRCHMFLKEKFDAQGKFDKIKARLAAGGNLQDKSVYESLSSPTVSLEAVMMVIAIAAIERRKIRSYDIAGAFLNADLPAGDDVFMELDPLLNRILAELDPTVVSHLDERGILVVRLNKALYGLVQSALLWYKKLRSMLEADGFVVNDYDACVFNKTVRSKQITICFHVDDLLVTCVDEQTLNEFQKSLEANFEEITSRSGNQHSYLAMNIEITSEGIAIDMKAYIAKVLEGRTVVRAKSPAGEDLFQIPDSPKLDNVKQKAFHSDVARLLYLAKRTRVDILTVISHLSSRVTEPTEDDFLKLERVVGYLAETADQILWFKADGIVNFEAYIDASFGVHVDGKSRTGIILMLAGAVIGAWSAKQKIVTKNSTESEIVAVSDGLNYVLWSRLFLQSQGYVLPPTVIFEDNEGVIKIMNNGRSTSHRTKHLKVRYFFARECMLNGDIKFVYKPTADMIADMCTKPLSGASLRHLISLLMGSTRA